MKSYKESVEISQEIKYLEEYRKLEMRMNNIYFQYGKK